MISGVVGLRLLMDLLQHSHAHVKIGRMESDLLNVSESFSRIAFRPSEAHLLKDAENF